MEKLLTANLEIAGQDMTGVVYEFRITGNREVLERPACLDTGTKGVGAGADSYELVISYVGDSSAATKLDRILWDAVDAAGGDGLLEFTGTMYPGAPGAGNPEYGGEFIVSESELGGTVGQYMLRPSKRFRMTGRPTVNTTP